MKVLKDNYTETLVEENDAYIYPRLCICERCSSELEYEKSDAHIGFLGCMYLTCPLCGNENMLYGDDEVGIKLTRKNIEFPMHFYHTSKETGASDCCNNEEVKAAINRAIDYFRNNKDEYHWSTSYGNLYVDVCRYEGDEAYEVMVTNNFYETMIPFEDADYSKA